MMTEEGILDIKDDPDNKLEDLELESKNFLFPLKITEFHLFL